jgi:hypothetical protein
VGLFALRAQFIQGLVLALLIVALASPALAAPAKKMQIQASVNPTQASTGVNVAITGRVLEPSNNASVANAVISIQVNNPQGTSIDVTIRYTDTSGVFEDAFLLAPNSPGGNYTAYLAAEKPGYDTAYLTLNFTYSTPDFSIESSVSALSLRQGQTGSVTVTVLSLRGFNQGVNITAIGGPTGVGFQFTPSSSIVPSGTVTINVTVPGSAQVGNYTVTFLGVSGSLTHKATLQLNISSGPLQSNFMFLVLGVALLIAILTSLGLVLRFRGRRQQREAVLEELLKQASADTGYVATARVIARLEELRAIGKVDEATYQQLKKEYEKRLEKSK